jgi:hypothetical protein
MQAAGRRAAKRARRKPTAVVGWENRMTHRAWKGYEEAMDLQHIKNEVRRIRTLVKQARENPQNFCSHEVRM